MKNQLTRLIITERDRQNMSQTDMAKRLKVSKQYYSKIENGGINLDQLIAICEILGLSIQLIPKYYLVTDL